MNRLSNTLTIALNGQITEEAYASQTYLSYAAWAGSQGYSGISTFLFRHAEEERNHMTKIIEYIIKRGATATIAAIAAPPAAPTGIHDCFEKILDQEVGNTKAIYAIARMSMQEEDWATWNFMQWFVKEQVEEESFAMALLDKLKIAGNEKTSHSAYYMLDQELGTATVEVRSATDATAVNP